MRNRQHAPWPHYLPPESRDRWLTTGHDGWRYQLIGLDVVRCPGQGWPEGQPRTRQQFASRARAFEVARMHGAGMSYREIGEVFGFGAQRARQLAQVALAVTDD